MTRHEYAYRMRLGIILLNLAMSSLLTFLSVSALMASRRFVVAELLGLPSTVDAFFYWIGALAFSLSLLWYALHLLLYAKGGKRLVLDAEGMDVPRLPVLRQTERVEFAKIKEVRDWGISIMRVLFVRHDAGLTRVPARMLPPLALDEIQRTLQSHVARG